MKRNDDSVEKRISKGGEGGGYGACGGEGEGDGGGRWRGIAEHEGVAAVPFRVVAVGLALFGVSAEEAGGGERVEVALGKRELLCRDLPLFAVHHGGGEVEFGKPAAAHHTAPEIGAELFVRECDGRVRFLCEVAVAEGVARLVIVEVCGGELQPAHLKETVCAPHRISVRVNGKELPGGSVEGALFAASALRPNNDDLVRADVDRAPRKKVFDPRADAPRFVKK